MNKRGSVTLFLSLMIGIVLFFLGLNLAKPLSDVVADARGTTQLNCTNAVEYQDKANCVMVDTLLPLFIGFLFALAWFVLQGI